MFFRNNLQFLLFCQASASLNIEWDFQGRGNRVSVVVKFTQGSQLRPHTRRFRESPLKQIFVLLSSGSVSFVYGVFRSPEPSLEVGWFEEPARIMLLCRPWHPTHSLSLQLSTLAPALYLLPSHLRGDNNAFSVTDSHEPEALCLSLPALPCHTFPEMKADFLSSSRTRLVQQNTLTLKEGLVHNKWCGECELVAEIILHTKPLKYKKNQVWN